MSSFPSLLHIGPEEEWGWETCVYDKYNIKAPCLVYSFGLVYLFYFSGQGGGGHR